jgi:hypothetical protein
MWLRLSRSIGYADREIGASLHANHAASTSLNAGRYGLAKGGNIVDFFGAELDAYGAAFAPIVVNVNGLVVLSDGVFDRPFFLYFELLDAHESRFPSASSYNEKQGFRLAPEPLC